VQRAEAELGVDRAEVIDAREQCGPAEGTRGANALEPIDDLQAGLRREQRQRRELAVLLERMAHAGQRGGLAEPERREALAERGDLHGAQLDVGRLHVA